MIGNVDILLFNPPYVPTDDLDPQDGFQDEEMNGYGISISWAGGPRGRVVIDQFLPLIPVSELL